MGEHKYLLFFPGLGLRKKLFEINMFSDLKIAPDLGQLPRSEEIFFNDYILPQTWGKSPVLGEIQLSKVSTHKKLYWVNQNQQIWSSPESLDSKIAMTSQF